MSCCFRLNILTQTGVTFFWYSVKKTLKLLSFLTDWMNFASPGMWFLAYCTGRRVRQYMLPAFTHILYCTLTHFQPHQSVPHHIRSLKDFCAAVLTSFNACLGCFLIIVHCYTAVKRRKFSVVNHWVLRGQWLQNFLTLFVWLVLDVFVICSKLQLITNSFVIMHSSSD